MRNEKALIRKVVRVVLPPDNDGHSPWFIIARENNYYVVWLMNHWEGTGLNPSEVIGPGTPEELIKLCRVFVEKEV